MKPDPRNKKALLSVHMRCGGFGFIFGPVEGFGCLGSGLRVWSLGFISFRVE